MRCCDINQQLQTVEHKAEISRLWQSGCNKSLGFYQRPTSSLPQLTLGDGVSLRLCTCSLTPLLALNLEEKGTRADRGLKKKFLSGVSFSPTRCFPTILLCSQQFKRSFFFLSTAMFKTQKQIKFHF